jgi:signal transduction histidine kinase
MRAREGRLPVRGLDIKHIVEIGTISPPSHAAPMDAAYDAYARSATARNVRVSALLVIVCCVLSRIPDRWVFAGIPGITERLDYIRAGHVALTGLAYLLLRIPAVARRPMAVAFPVAMGCTFTFGYFLARQGGLETPWFHFTYPLMALTLLPLAPFAWRAAFGLAIAASLLLGLAMARPFLPPHPMLGPAVGLLLFSTATALACSQFINRMVRRGFVQEQMQKETANKLAELNATLEQRVRAQTSELRMLAAHLETTREDEQARISRELHDELGQELTALRYALTFLKKRYERDPGNIRGNVEELESLLARTSTTLRNLVSELRPRVLDDLGLDAGVEWLLRRTEERAGLSCRLMSKATLDLDVDVSIAAFRILQESLTNVVRHAKATHVDVRLDVEGDDLYLAVEDDGIGPPESRRPRSAPGAGGVGIIGMRERADALGG